VRKFLQMDLYAGMRIECKCIYCTLILWQAIEAAIKWGLKKVEAGAQGEHKKVSTRFSKATCLQRLTMHIIFQILTSGMLSPVSCSLQCETIQVRFSTLSMYEDF
jgi:predicted N-acyltransferase